METISIRTVGKKVIIMVKDVEGKPLSTLSTEVKSEVPALIKKAKQYFPDAVLTA